MKNNIESNPSFTWNVPVDTKLQETLTKHVRVLFNKEEPSTDFDIVSVKEKPAYKEKFFSKRSKKKEVKVNPLLKNIMSKIRSNKS